VCRVSYSSFGRFSTKIIYYLIVILSVYYFHFRTIEYLKKPNIMFRHAPSHKEKGNARPPAPLCPLPGYYQKKCKSAFLFADRIINKSLYNIVCLAMKILFIKRTVASVFSNFLGLFCCRSPNI
jgi:hypothetical protein